MPDFISKTGDRLPVLTDTLTLNGVAVNLTGATVQLNYRRLGDATGLTRTAAIVSAVAGTVKYEWITGDLAVPGDYLADWSVTLAGLVEHYPKEDPFTFAFRVTPPAVTANALEACREVVRVLLGDHWVPYEYDNDTVDSGLRAMLATGELPGYALAADRMTIVPALGGPNVLALLCYKCAKTFVQAERDYAYKARALGESMKERRTLLTELSNKVRGLDGSATGLSTGGGGFSSFQNFYTWMLGTAGLPLGAVQARLDMEGPGWFIVSVNAGGAHSG